MPVQAKAAADHSRWRRVARGRAIWAGSNCTGLDRRSMDEILLYPGLVETWGLAALVSPWHQPRVSASRRLSSSPEQIGLPVSYADSRGASGLLSGGCSL